MSNNCSMNNKKNEKSRNNIRYTEKDASLFGKGFKRQVDNLKKNITVKDRNGKEKTKITYNDAYTVIADAIGYAEASNMSDWKNGKEIPSISVVLKLCDFFKCTPNELLKNMKPNNTYKDIPEKLTRKLDYEMKISKSKKYQICLMPQNKKMIKQEENMSDIKSINFYADLITSEYTDKAIGILNQISSEFRKLSKKEIEHCKLAIKSNNLKIIEEYRDDYTIQLETLFDSIKNSKVKNALIELKGQLDMYVDINKSAYILRLFNSIIENCVEK